MMIYVFRRLVDPANTFLSIKRLIGKTFKEVKAMKGMNYGVRKSSLDGNKDKSDDHKSVSVIWALICPNSDDSLTPEGNY